MKKFKFNLEKLKDYRKILEQEAQREFAEAQSIYIKELKILEKMKHELSDSFLKRSEIEQKGGSSAKALEQIYIFQKGQDIRIALQNKKLQQLEKEVESKQVFLRQKAIEYKIMDKLKEQKKQDFIEKYIKEEAALIDEQNILRYKK